MRDIARIIFALCFFSISLAGSAQIPLDAPQGVASQDTRSLAAVLGTAVLPAHRLFLTVSAETVTLPPDSGILPDRPSLTDVTDAFGRSVHAFGSVTAIAPPTMVVLNIHPDPPDIYAGLQPNQAFKLLSASLSDTQWQALIGEHGLGMPDLTNEDQQHLFQAIFPESSLKITAMHPLAGTLNEDLDLSHELPQVRLRLDDGVQMGMASKQPPDSWIEFPVDPAAYRWHPPLMLSMNAPAGVPQSAEIPNVPKPGQLDWNRTVLRTLIPLTGLKTVGDLVSRVGQITHLELYADRHYEGRALTILGPIDDSAPASDLLQALACCVTGTFRKVGPAYVLTDDVVGVATRRQRLADFDRDGALPLTKKLTEAGDLLFTKHSLRDLAVFDDPLAPSTAQWAAIRSVADADLPWLGTDLMMDQLTPAQQADIRDKAQQLAQSSASNTSPLDLTRNMRIRLRPQLELLVPSLDSPVTTPFSLHDLFKASIQLSNARNQANQMRKPHRKHDAPVTLAQAMQMTARRAVLVQPHTLADLDSTITTMQRLGFNQLWLDVFSGGRTHLTSSEGDGDLLTEAIKKTRGTGIQVFAVMDLFGWNTSAPPDAVDLTVLGETSVQDDERRQQASLAEEMSGGFSVQPAQPAKPLLVTPLAPEVQARLGILVRSLARRPGLTGFVWRDTAPAGYIAAAPGEGVAYAGVDSPLGYTESARLTFLRRQHADPIDVFQPLAITLSGNNDVSNPVVINSAGIPIGVLPPEGMTLPNFDNSDVDTALNQAWEKYRAAADVLLLRRLYSAASRPNSARKPWIWIERRDREEDEWYGLWNSPNSPLVAWQLKASTDGPYELDRIARIQTPSALLMLDTHTLPKYTGLAALLYSRLKNTSWDGFTLDMTLPGTPSLGALSQPATANEDNTKATR